MAIRILKIINECLLLLQHRFPGLEALVCCLHKWIRENVPCRCARPRLQLGVLPQVCTELSASSPVHYRRNLLLSCPRVPGSMVSHIGTICLPISLAKTLGEPFCISSKTCGIACSANSHNSDSASRGKNDRGKVFQFTANGLNKASVCGTLNPLQTVSTPTAVVTKTAKSYPPA